MWTFTHYSSTGARIPVHKFRYCQCFLHNFSGSRWNLAWIETAVLWGTIITIAFKNAWFGFFQNCFGLRFSIMRLFLFHSQVRLFSGLRFPGRIDFHIVEGLIQKDMCIEDDEFTSFRNTFEISPSALRRLRSGTFSGEFSACRFTGTLTCVALFCVFEEKFSFKTSKRAFDAATT